MNINKIVFGFMKMVKTKLFKIFYFDILINRYVPLNGLFTSFECSNFSDVFCLNFIKIPFFGYYSPQFTALGPRALAVNEKAED